MKRRVFSLALLLSLIWSLAHAVTPALAEGDDDDGGGTVVVEAGASGGGCGYNFTGEEGWVPASCSGWVTIYERGDQVGDNQCKWYADRMYNCDTGDTAAIDTWSSDTGETVVGACTLDEGGAPPPCGQIVWNGGLEWSSEGAGGQCSTWAWNLRVAASLPGMHLSIVPYPVTLVGYPTWFRFDGLSSSTAQATLPFVGSGTPADPEEGDQANIVLRLYFVPARQALDLHMPGLGFAVDNGKECRLVENVSLPLHNPTSRPYLKACWDLPSHPAAGATGMASQFFGADDADAIPPDMPLFLGWGRVPFFAYWQVSYDEWTPIRECVPGGVWKNGEYVSECTPPGGGFGHWDIVDYEWRRHAQGGLVDPDVVAGLAPGLKADLNGDGDADAFWSYNVQIGRMNEAFFLNDPVWGKEWTFGGWIPLAVREGQALIAWPDGGRVRP